MEGTDRNWISFNEEHLKRMEALSTFNEIGKALTSTLDVKEILRIVMEKIRQLIGPKNWSLLLVDEERNDLFFEIVVGKEANRIKGMRLKMGEGIAGWVAKEGIPLYVPDVRKDKRFTNRIDKLTNFTTRSIICVPLKSKGKVLGAIELINEMEERPFTDEDMLLLTTLADYAAIAIENAKYLKKVEELTITDDLTGLYNSRFLHRFLDYEVERTKRYEMELSLIFFDIDYFKSINDTYGHLCGSHLLAEVGRLLQKTVRKVDVPCRYGGDEFIVVMPQTGKKAALSAAKKLREKINNNEFLKEEGLKIKITASFGVASLPEDTNDKLGLLHLADQAMYKIKNTEKDGIAVA